ncbi:hypothetical protein N5079_15915 [Planotetraspora sp. A-T 1434]|uniref:hypothetical protein n=1 Tax=Planotetraspora sp. A-T 1434 TaxID=2979219 RepID=UPI0021C1D178|nr:hypothetical protein [Planotetraspora sp. A-T 1434]MCT9931699.1 hypothetical protein [Planotetraspora sp. A-T 1434]
MTFAGIAIFVVVNLLAFIATLSAADSVGSGKNIIMGVGAVILAAAALGGGAVLIMLRKPWSRGLGLGLMIGWALMSIVSVGFCTGINPAIYTDGAL